MRTQLTIERHSRYILSAFDLHLHKRCDEYGRPWYYIRGADEDQSAPDVDSREWMPENKLISFVEEKEEELQEWRYEERERRAEAAVY